DARAAPRPQCRDAIADVRVPPPRAGHQDHARLVTGADEDVLRPGRTVKEAPLPEQAFLTLDEQSALPRQHQERLLLRLSVVEAVRLTRGQDMESDAELRKRALVALERAVRA